MKKILLVSLVFVAFLMTIGCGSNTVAKTETSTNPILKTVATPTPESIVMTPKTIVLSKVKKDFIPFPSCYGGECYEITFLVEFKFEKEEYMVKDFSFGGFVEKKGTSKTKKEILAGNKLYKTLLNIDPKKVSVAFDEGKVTHISIEGKTLWKYSED